MLLNGDSASGWDIGSQGNSETAMDAWQNRGCHSGGRGACARCFITPDVGIYFLLFLREADNQKVIGQIIDTTCN